MVTGALIKRTVLLGCGQQLAAVARHAWTRLCGDPLPDARSNRDFDDGAMQAQRAGG